MKVPTPQGASGSPHTPRSETPLVQGQALGGQHSSPITPTHQTAGLGEITPTKHATPIGEKTPTHRATPIGDITPTQQASVYKTVNETIENLLAPIESKFPSKEKFGRMIEVLTMFEQHRSSGVALGGSAALALR